MKTLLEIHEKQVKSIRNSKETGKSPISSGFRSLDRLIGGFCPGELIILGARPSMGKTALALTMVRNMWRDNVDILYYSLDLAEMQLYYRILAMLSDKKLPPYSEVAFSEELLQSMLEKHSEEIWDASLAIECEYTGSLNLYVEAVSQFAQRKSKRKFIVVDNIQNFQNKGHNRDREIAGIMKVIKEQARILEIPTMCLSQLSRNVEARGGDKRPGLSDLRDSGALENEADKVFFLHRAEYYGFTQDSEGNSTRGRAELIIASNNNGICGETFLHFNDSKALFSDPGIIDDINFTKSPFEDPF